MGAVTQPVTRGTYLRGYRRYPAQYTPDPRGIIGTCLYYVTAVKHDRAYVTLVEGRGRANRVKGYDNQWIALSDVVPGEFDVVVL